MPKVIQTGESVTLSGVQVRDITFRYVQPDSEKSGVVLSQTVTYWRLHEDGTPYDLVSVEGTVPDDVAAVLAPYWTEQETAVKTAEQLDVIVTAEGRSMQAVALSALAAERVMP